MYLQFVLLLFAALLAAWPTYSVNNDWYAHRILDAQNVNTLKHIDDALSRYFDVHFSYPDSLDNWDDEYIIPTQPNQKVLYKKIDVVDAENGLVYQKYLLALAKNREPLGGEYLLDNQCGNKAFDSGETFCGASSANWIIKDSRAKIAELTALQSARLNHTAQRFFESSGLPTSPTNKTIALSNALDNGERIDCYGVNKFQTVSLSCLDMFSVTGGDVFYQLEESNRALLFVVMPFQDEAGQHHVVVKELKK